MDLNLLKRTALVSGASTGIGTGIAQALATEGVRLAITARRLTKALLPSMQARQWGRIINVGGPSLREIFRPVTLASRRTSVIL
jgi:NADP-dependent 3-hydroxy acid dehydrogenase YdfG